ncbi:MAG: hypothetical protein ACLQAT_03800 [Candidatus Binataceae bacterium]
MAEKQKPFPDVVKVAARILKHPETATRQDAQRMAARIMDDEKNDPEPHKQVGRKLNPRNRAAEIARLLSE